MIGGVLGGDVRNIWRVCHTGCSYNTWRFGSGSSQFSTHCMSWVDCSMRLSSGRREELLPGTWTIGSCKHPASAYSEGCAVRERDDTHSEDHPRNEGGDEETVRHRMCERGVWSYD